MQNFFVVNSSFNLIKHPEGAVDHKFNLNSSVAPIQNLHTTVRLHLGLEISSHDIVEKIGTFEETYIVPVEFDQDDIRDCLAYSQKYCSKSDYAADDGRSCK